MLREAGSGSVFSPERWRGLHPSRGDGFLLFLILLLSIGILLLGVAGTWGPFKDGLRVQGDPRFFLAMMALGAVFSILLTRMLQVTLIADRKGGRRPIAETRPWTSDHPWRPQGQGPDYAGNTGGFLLGAIGFFGLLALFNLVFTSPSPLLLRGIVLLFDLFGLVILLDFARKAWQETRHGRPQMRWTTFPAFLGGRLEGVFLIQPPLRPNGPVKAVLRCVQDTGAEAASEPFVIYRQTRELDAGSGVLRELPVSFDIPADLPGTNLYRGDARYWQVLLQVPVTGPDFETIFLAPVYERKPDP